MGFQIEVKTGDEGTIIMCGCPDGTVEFCKWIDQTRKDKVTGESVRNTELIAYKYYASVEQAFAKVARMRIGSANASTLKELLEAIKQIRQDIKKEMSVL